MDPTTISPFIFNTIQNTYLSHLSQLFGMMNHYAVQLFYILATLEITFFGLIWALKQQDNMGHFLFKIIKLGIIFYLISNYNNLISILVNGLTQISLSSVSPQAAKVIFSPDLLWKYGFDSAISLLSLAVQYGSTNVGITSIYLTLGFGILTLFALIACQIILLITAFYIQALVSLLFLPFGAFGLTEDFLASSLQSLFKGAVKIFALILIVGIGISIWATFSPTSYSNSTTLDQPLGLFFATLIIAILTWKVPPMVAEVVGHLGGSLFHSNTDSVATSAPVVSVQSSTTVTSPLAAATSIQGSTGSAAVSIAGQMSNTSVSAPSVSVSGSTGPNLSGLNKGISELNRAVKMHSEGISKSTLSKLKSTFKE
jgi:type IV secretion system protein TrbL